MKKTIVVVLISLILGAAAGYADTSQYRHWKMSNKYLKQAECLLMVKGYLAAIEILKTSVVSLESAEKYLLCQIPDLRMEDYAKMIMYHIELFYMEGKFREASFPVIFAAAVIEIAHKMSDIDEE